jgi:hypothetical protein
MQLAAKQPNSATAYIGVKINNMYENNNSKTRKKKVNTLGPRGYLNIVISINGALILSNLQS